MQELIFAPSWWMLGLAVVVPIALFWVANNRLDKTLRLVSFALFGLAVLWIAVSVWIDTPRETADKGSHRFVEAAVGRDTRTLSGLLSPEVSLGSLGKEQILAVLPEYADEWGLRSALVTGTNLEDRGGQVVADLTIFSQHEGGPVSGLSTIRSSWEFVWGRTPDGWKIVQITPTKVGETSVSDVVGRYFNRARKP